MSLVVTTVFDVGDYEEGVAALLHSLGESGYRGQVWCGVRDPSRSRLARAFDGRSLDGRVEMRFVAIETSHHLANYKPHFMLDVAARNPAATHLVYFDPDLVIKCGWSFVARWCSQRIAAVGDENWLMPSSSPVRDQWRQLRTRLELDASTDEQPVPLDLYCNSGFVGLPLHHRGFLELWARLTDEVLKRGSGEEQQLMSREGAEPVTVSDGRSGSVKQIDQELFNMTLEAFGAHTSLMGPEAMDFSPGGRIFSHATGSPKPWNKRYIHLALRGYPPSKRDGEVLRRGPGQLSFVSDSVHRRRLAAYRVARVIGGFVRRTDF